MLTTDDRCDRSSCKWDLSEFNRWRRMVDGNMWPSVDGLGFAVQGIADPPPPVRQRMVSPARRGMRLVLGRRVSLREHDRSRPGRRRP